MTTNPAVAHADSIFENLTRGDDDPRRTRIDFVQVAHYVASACAENEQMASVYGAVQSLVAAQEITRDDLAGAARFGWPVMRSVEGPESYLYATGRLISHGALRTPFFVERLRYARERPVVLEERLARWRETIEPDLFAALIRGAAERAAEPGLFRHRLIAAAKDADVLLSGDELPTGEDFLTSQRGDWPPLRLGIAPVAGGRFNENPDDWNDGGGGGSGGAGGDTIVICDGGRTLGSAVTCILTGVAFLVVLVVISKTGGEITKDDPNDISTWN